jgi:Rps23 Pro-64 3,4-dihydroxylase Tpa1-like proline 4-hydroxylase
VFEVKELAVGIVSYTNVMSDPAGFISDIEGLVEINNLNWFDASQTNNEAEAPTTVKSIRDCKVMSLPQYDSNPELKNTNPGAYLAVHELLNSELNGAINHYKESYLASQWSTSEGWQLLKYGKNNHFVNHYDDARAFPRTVSMSFYLNDDYEGGEIEFPRFNLTIKPKANQMIMFPSNYIYNHSVHPVISGLRYAVVAWWN